MKLTSTNKLDHIRDTTGVGISSHSNNYGAAVDIKDQASGNYTSRIVKAVELLCLKKKIHRRCKNNMAYYKKQQ